MRLAFVFAAFACASCDQLASALGPSDKDIRASLADFYGRQADHPLFSAMILPEQMRFKDAKIARSRGCESMGATFFCQVEFEMPDGRRVKADVHLQPAHKEINPLAGARRVPSLKGSHRGPTPGPCPERDSTLLLHPDRALTLPSPTRGEGHVDPAAA